MRSWTYYTSNEIEPRGWLMNQLKTEAKGLAGNLDKVWGSVRDSAWIGGDNEGWERVPYWLDGFVPLAYLIGDKLMIKRAKRYIDAIISRQKEDGWICPCEDDKRSEYDPWAILLVTKTLLVYYQQSGDERIPDVILRVMKNLFDLMKSGVVKLFGWGKYRWFEGFIAISFLKERYGEEWLDELAGMLKEQGTDYNLITSRWERPINRWTLDTHIVNLTMMLKAEALAKSVLGCDYSDDAEKFVSILDKFNGTPVGLFTGDECLSGISPIQGTELCAVVEQMYSYETLFALTGDTKWLDRLELIGLNALPAAFSDDMWAHQYDQMSNQISCVRFPGRSVFRTNGPDAHIFGLEPSYGCCTANMAQGFPKLALSCFAFAPGRIISALPFPSKLRDDGIEIDLRTNYPFGDTLSYTVSSNRDFTFTVRIPSFVEKLTINGEESEIRRLVDFKISAGEQRQIKIRFFARPRLVARPGGLFTLRRGSLVFSLPIEYEKKMREYTSGGVERKFPYCDYDYIGKSDFNYAFAGRRFRLVRRRPGKIPFSSVCPPVSLEADMVKIDWGLEDGFETVCAKLPRDRKPIGKKEKIELCPYGCAKLRMTELPMAASSKKRR